MSLITSSPKTTTAGWLTILIGILGLVLQIVGKDVQADKVVTDLTSVSAGIGLIKAKDHDR